MRAFLVLAAVAAVLATAQAGVIAQRKPTSFGTFRKDSAKQPIPSINLLDKLKKKDSASLDVSNFVDNVFDILDPSVPNSIKLNDVSQNFRVKFLNIKVPVSVSAKSGSLTGLKKTYRASDASLSTDDLGYLYLDTAIAFPELKFGYDYELKLSNLNLGPSGHFNATWSSPSVHVRLAVDVNFLSCSVSADSIEAADLGSLQVQATGLGPLNGLYSELLSSLAQKLGREQLVSAISTYLNSHSAACSHFLKNWTEILPQ